MTRAVAAVFTAVVVDLSGSSLSLVVDEEAPPPLEEPPLRLVVSYPTDPLRELAQEYPHDFVGGEEQRAAEVDRIEREVREHNTQVVGARRDDAIQRLTDAGATVGFAPRLTPWVHITATNDIAETVAAWPGWHVTVWDAPPMRCACFNCGCSPHLLDT